jgi:hypothetical protein
VTGNAICGLFMAAGAVLLFLRLRPAVARIAWSALLAVSLTYAVALALATNNLININVAHYYLGAKYSFPYSSFYKLVNAALERPQVDMRDLDNPARLIRADEQDQRAYYIDLLRSRKENFDPLASTNDLRQNALESGAIQIEAEQILGTYLPPEQIEPFRRDVRTAFASFGWDQDITRDYGYNGSPWYSVVRHLDPTLYFPLSSATAVLNLVVQLLGTLVIAWLIGTSLDLQTESKLAIAALLFSSWDFVGYALEGLIFVGLWLPIALAVFFAKRGKGMLAGMGIAWAGLIKLFPFALILPVAGLLIKGGTSEWANGTRSGVRRWSVTVLMGIALTTAVLITVSALDGRSWSDFLSKIVHQFQSDSYLLNSVSLSKFLMALGITQPFVPILVSTFFLGLVTAMVLYSNSAVSVAKLPLRLLLVASVIGLVMRTTWFSYYAVAPIFLLPFLVQHYRLESAIAAFLLSVSFFLPDFDNPVLMANPILHIVKLLPYIAIPIWLIWRELATARVPARVRNSILVIGLICLVVTGGDAWRMASIRRLDRSAGQHLDAGEAALAAADYQQLSSLDPGNAIALLNEGIALAMQGPSPRAEQFMAEAVGLAPDSAVCHHNYGLLLLQTGDFAGARTQIEEALRLAPNDAELLCDGARLYAQMGDRAQAMGMLTRARELAPGQPGILALLNQVQRESIR